MALTPKQTLFVQEYLVSLNATEAAVKAGYKEKTAAQQGYKLLKMPKVSAAIQSSIAARSKRTEVDQDFVIQQLKTIAEGSAADYQDSKLKYANKIRALELLGKHLGMFNGTGAGEDGGVTIVDDV